MSRRASTFDRLALREQVLINRQMRGLGELNNEFQKIDQMRQKLDEMAREQVPNDGEQIAGTFRVTAQLNHQIRKQLETASNRCDHLAIELQNMRKKLLCQVAVVKNLQARRMNCEQMNAMNVRVSVKMTKPHAGGSITHKNF